MARAEVDVSLAEKMPSGEASARTLQPAGSPNIDNILRLALNGAGGSRLPAAQPAERSGAEVDFGKAAILLDRATGALAQLTARKDELEQAAAAREDYYGEKVRQLQDQAAEWERRAKVIKAQLQDSESRLSEQQTRIDTLSYRAENAEARALMAEQQAADARKQLQLYHDKILQTFGSLA